MSDDLISLTAAEVAEVLSRRRRSGHHFPGFVPAPERQTAGLAQLREHFAEDRLSGELLSEAELVARAVGRAEALEREVGEREGVLLALMPLEERFAGHPQTLRVLGLSEPPQRDRRDQRDRGPSEELRGLELGPELRRVLGRRAAS